MINNKNTSDYIIGQVYHVYSDVDPLGTFVTVAGSDIAAGTLVISPIPASPLFYQVTTDYAPAMIRENTPKPTNIRK